MYLYVKMNWDPNCFFSAESKDYEFRFVWVQKYVGWARGKICVNWNAGNLLENLSPEDFENVVDYIETLALYYVIFSDFMLNNFCKQTFVLLTK